MRNSTVILENSLAVSCKIKHDYHMIQQSHSYIFKKVYTHTKHIQNVHNSSSYNSSKLGRIHQLVSELTNWGAFTSWHITQQTTDTNNKIDES